MTRRHPKIKRTSHEQHGIDAEQPVPLEHLASLMEENLGLVLRGFAALALGSLSTKEDFALWQKQSYKRREGREASGSPEERAPCLRGVGDEREVDDGCEEVADGIALLENAGSESTDLDGQVLKRGGGGKAPDSTHGDTKEGTDAEECREGSDEAGAEFEDSDEEEVCDEWPFAAETVRDDAKDDLKGGQESDFRRRRVWRWMLTAPTERKSKVSVIAVV